MYRSFPKRDIRVAIPSISSVENILHLVSEIKAVAALLGVSGVSLYRGLTTKTKNVRGQILRSLCDSAVVSIIAYLLGYPVRA